MANELLKFRKGLYADLAGVAKDPGTIYVTTDEQAMYIDIDSSTRIRLGETIHFADLTEFQSFLDSTTPPYDTRAFYYIEKENALLKWVSEGGKFQNKGNWKQINSTSGIEADLSALEEEVNTLKTTVAGNTTNIGTNAAAIEAINTAIGNASDATGDSLWAAINANKKAIESNDTDIENLNTNKLDKSEFETFKTTNAEAIKAIDDKVGTKDDASTVDTAFGRIKALEEADETKASQEDVNALKTTVYGGTDKDQSTATEGSLVKKVESLETNKANASDLNELSKIVSGHTTNITELTTNLGNPNAEAGDDSAFARIKQLEEAVGDGTGESLSGRLEAVEKTLNGDGTDQGLVKDVEDIQTALGSKDDKSNVDSIYGNLAALEEKNSEQDNNIVGLNYAINGNPDGATEADKAGLAGRLSAVEQQVNDINEELGDKVDGTSGDTVWEAVKDAQDQGTTALGQIGTQPAEGVTGSTLWEAVKNAQSAASTNATEITNINNEIGNADGSEEGTLWNAIKTNATDIDKLEQTIASEINAANGMTYKGGVGSVGDLNAITTPAIGDTYVATDYFEFTQDSETKKVYAGDLLVASGTENDDGVITADLKWTLVNTGYIQSHEATLGVATITKGAQINLNSYVSTLGGTPNSGDLGKVQIVSDNLIITSTYNDATKTSEIKINAVWGDFGASASTT